MTSLDIELKKSTVCRPYQEQAVQSINENGKLRSGVIVLPCGAGKTLVGIASSCAYKKGTLVFCTSSESAQQWKREYLEKTNIEFFQICAITSENKTFFASKAGVAITTYSMIASASKTSETKGVIDKILEKDWGLVILDETHVVPAASFSKVLEIKAECFLGLTATLVREDEKIDMLHEKVGPIIYKADWKALESQGYLAKVRCLEVTCPMSAGFKKAYEKEQSSSKRSTLSILNPNKIRMCQFLINHHVSRGDKILVFCDGIPELALYSFLLRYPSISGKDSHTKRQNMLDSFRNTPHFNVLMISRIGDASIDIPDASVVIQIAYHHGSRRQEAQRLGRTSRPKNKKKEEGDENPDSFFYSIVSEGTSEAEFAINRKKFLVEQGYDYATVLFQDLPIEDDATILFSDAIERDDVRGLMKKLSALERDPEGKAKKQKVK